MNNDPKLKNLISLLEEATPEQRIHLLKRIRDYKIILRKKQYLR